MVWIHGGSFSGGSAMDYDYYGVPMVAVGDVIVVTINYRLAIFAVFSTGRYDGHCKFSSKGTSCHKSLTLSVTSPPPSLITEMIFSSLFYPKLDQVSYYPNGPDHLMDIIIKEQPLTIFNCLTRHNQ